MSLKDPKKVHENEEFAIFKGKDGHELKILKSGLSKSLLKKLSELPLHAEEGGQIASPTKEEVKDKGFFDTEKLKRDWGWANPFSDQVGGYAERIKPEAPRSYSSQTNIAPRSNEEPIKEGVTSFMGDNGGPKQSLGVDTNIAPNEAEEPSAPVETPQSQPEEFQITDPQPIARAPQERAPRNIGQEAADFGKKKNEEMNYEDKAWEQDLANGHITPMTYADFFGEGTLGKIGSIFGMMLAGAGAGLTKGPNILLEMMNKEIERDMEAKKQSKINAQTFIRNKQEDELRKAQIREIDYRKGLTSAQSRLASAEASFNEIKTEALANMLNKKRKVGVYYLESLLPKLPPEQRAAGQQLLSYVRAAADESILQTNQQTANKLATDRQAYEEEQEMLRMSGMFGLPGGEAVAQHKERLEVPGIGRAQIEVPESARKELQETQLLIDSANDLLNYSKKHTNLVPGMPGYEEGVTKALTTQQMVREAMLRTVFRESEKPLLQKFVTDNPAGAFKQFTTQPRLRAIIDSARIKSNSVRGMYGLPTLKRSPGEGDIGVNSKGERAVYRGGSWVRFKNKK